MVAQKFASQFKEALCLLYYDIPLLSYYTDMQGRHYFVLAADFSDDLGVLWYIFEASNDTIKLYAHDKLSLLDVLSQSPSIYYHYNTFIDENNDAFGARIDFADIPDCNKPTHLSFCESPDMQKLFSN